MAPTARHMDGRGQSLSWPDDSPGGTVLARTARGRTVVELHGEIDLAVVLATTPQLHALTTDPGPRVVADLRPVSFIDCSGLAMLVDVRSRVLARDGLFTVVCDDPRVLRLLRITGLSALLAPVPTLDVESGTQDDAEPEVDNSPGSRERDTAPEGRTHTRGGRPE